MSDADRQQLRERMQNLSPEQRAEFFAGRGGSGRGERGGVRDGAGTPRRRANQNEGATVPAVERGATTIDALFAPLEVIETNGRVWVLDAGQLRPVAVRLGVTNGTATELVATPGGRRRARPGPESRIAEFRQQVEAIEDPEVRQNFERMIERLESEGAEATPQASLPTSAVLEDGAQLVTGVTIPDVGSSARSSGGGSPLIPQRPNFGGRR
jgi:hypothetical protein